MSRYSKFFKDYSFNGSSFSVLDLQSSHDCHIAPLLIAAAPAIISGVASLAGAAISHFGQKKANQQNQENYEKNFDYNAAVQQKTWQREDTQAQRAVSDYTKAGFSPLAAVGQGTSSTPVTQNGSADIQNTGATAGDIINNVGTTIASMINNYQMHKETLEAQKDMQEKQIEATHTDIEYQEKAASERAEADRSATRDNVLSQLESAASIAQQNNNTQLAIAANQVAEQLRANTAREALEAQKATEQWIDNQLKDYPGAKIGQMCHSWSEYREKMDSWSTRFNAFLELSTKNLQDSESASSGSSSSLGVNASANLGVGSGISSMFGGQNSSNSAGASGGISESSAANGSKSYSQNQLVDNKIKAWLAKNPMPILSREVLYQ